MATRKRQRQREGDLDQIALKQQSSSARQSSRLRTRNATGAPAEPLLGSQLAATAYGRGSNSGQHLGRVPSFGDASLNLKQPPNGQTASRQGAEKASPRHGSGSLRSLAVEDPQESMMIRRTMSISRQRPQISTAEVVPKQQAQGSRQSSRQKKATEQENLFADEGDLIREDEFDQMANKANAISYKNRGVSQQAMARIAPTGGAGGKRAVHEIHAEDIQRVDAKDRSGGSRRLTRQRSRTINEQTSQEGRLKRPAASNRKVTFGQDESLTQITPEDQSEVGEPPAPDMQTSLMQIPSASVFTRGGDTGSRSARGNAQAQPQLQRNLQKSSHQPETLQEFSNYPQMSALRPMDGNYQALNKQHSILLQRQGSVTRARNHGNASNAVPAKGVEKQFSFTQFGDPYQDTPAKQAYPGAPLDPPTPKSPFKNLRADGGGMNLGIGEMQHSIIGSFPLSTSLQPYAQDSRSRRARPYNRWPLGVTRQSSSQIAREEHQVAMMELRANDNGFQFAPYDGRPTRTLLNVNDRTRGGKIYPEGMQRVSLNVGGKRNSGGIRDDESILCPTPPNREPAGGFDLSQPQEPPAGRLGQPTINFTVNVNNTGPYGYMPQAYFGNDDKEIEQYNMQMMSKLEQLPNPSHNAQSLVPIKTRSSQRRDGYKKEFEKNGEYIEPEGTGNFNDDESLDDQTQQGGKAQSQKVESTRKRELKQDEKEKAQQTKQQTSSSKKTVQFNMTHKQDSNDSILKMSEQGTKLKNAPSNESPSSSKKSRTRGPGKKTIERQATMALDPQLTLLKKKSTTVENLACKCSRSRCLKMYCECFTQGRFCDETCSCKDCLNTEANTEKIRAARRNIRNRNPQAFKPKVQHLGPHRLFVQPSQRAQAFMEGRSPDQNLKVKGRASQTKSTRLANIDSWHISGCRCKKSNCQKKYCECFQMGVLCNPERCQCVECKNTKAEVQRRMDNDNFLNEFADFIN